MTIEELKSKILNNSITETFFVFRYEENKFIPKQYAKEIAKLQRKSIAIIDDITDCEVDDFFDDLDLSTLYILDLNKVDVSSFDDYTMQSILDKGISLIIICNKLENENSPIGTGLTSIQDYIVDFPKLLDWQILDYMKMKCSLNDVELKWLQEITKNDIYRIENELEKLTIFETFRQEDIFNQINKENGYGDLNSFNIFNLTNAILKRDLKTIKDILKSIDNIDVEPVGLVTIMYNNIKNIINIQLNPNATAESLNMNQKQFNAIRYNCGKYTASQLLNIFDFLTMIDYKLKSGKLQFTDNQFIDYIICNII